MYLGPLLLRNTVINSAANSLLDKKKIHGTIHCCVVLRNTITLSFQLSSAIAIALQHPRRIGVGQTLWRNKFETVCAARELSPIVICYFALNVDFLLSPSTDDVIAARSEDSCSMMNSQDRFADESLLIMRSYHSLEQTNDAAAATLTVEKNLIGF